MIHISNREIKEVVYSLGADLCGVASIDRFESAPSGFHPRDVFPNCKSVISFAVRFPVGALICDTPVPYTRIRNSLTPKMDAIALDLCIELEKRGIVAVPIPMKACGTKKQKESVPLFLKSMRHKRRE